MEVNGQVHVAAALLPGKGIYCPLEGRLVRLLCMDVVRKRNTLPVPRL
jgi:hypothetical protein